MIYRHKNSGVTWLVVSEGKVMLLKDRFGDSSKIGEIFEMETDHDSWYPDWERVPFNYYLKLL